MFKWFVNNLKIMGLGLIVIVFAILFSPLVYLLGVAILGYACWQLYCMGQDDEGAMMHTEQKSQLNDNESQMVSNRRLKKYIDKDLNERNIVIKISIPSDDNSFNFSRGFSDFLGAFFTPYSKKTKPNRLVNPLTNAALQCKEQTDIQNFEVRMITRALKDFNLEAGFLVAQKRAILRAGFFQNDLDNEPPILIESREWEGKHLLNKLHDLMENLPKSLFEDNPCLEAIESYLKERIAHHEKILAVAEVLLPNLSDWLNEAKAASSLQINSSPK